MSTTAPTTLGAPSAAERIAEIPLIPREALFGNPSKAGGQISPDGQWLGWMAPHDGVMNVWLAPAADPLAARRMTNATDRPIPLPPPVTKIALRWVIPLSNSG